MATPPATAELAAAIASTRFGPARWESEVDSTNRILLDEARAGGPRATVLLAEHQTAGRGRRDRTWTAPSGSSLLMSVDLPAPIDDGRLPLATVAMALAAASGCERVAGVRPDLKWPNDLLLGDRKVAGILAESVEGADGRRVVVGIGINVSWPAELPADIADTAVALNHVTGADADRVALAAAVLRDFDEQLARLESDPGPLVAELRSRCVTLGRQVRVDFGDRAVTGRALDVDDTGALIVDVDGERLTVRAADVVHLRDA